MSISSLSQDQTRKLLRQEPANPIRLLSLTMGVTALAMLCMLWNAFTSINQIKQLERRYLRVEQLRVTIVHLDEVLTISARMSWTAYESPNIRSDIGFF